MTDTSTDDTERREDLWNGGICPVCGEGFIDGFDPLNEGQSYDGRICVTDKDEETGDGHMLVHIRDINADTDTET